MRHYIHARLELSSQRGSEVMVKMIEQQSVGMISLMDHSPGQGQYTTEQAYRDYIMQTTHRSAAEVDEILIQKRSQLVAIPERIASVTSKARAAGLAIATHDDDTVCGNRLRSSHRLARNWQTSRPYHRSIEPRGLPSCTASASGWPGTGYQQSLLPLSAPHFISCLLSLSSSCIIEHVIVGTILERGKG